MGGDGTPSLGASGPHPSDFPRDPCWQADDHLPDSSAAASGCLLPAGCRFPRGQYVETPPHSAGCPLAFRSPGLGTLGGSPSGPLGGSGGSRSSLMTHPHHPTSPPPTTGAAQCCPLWLPQRGVTPDSTGPCLPPGSLIHEWGQLCTCGGPAQLRPEGQSLLDSPILKPPCWSWQPQAWPRAAPSAPASPLGASGD